MVLRAQLNEESGKKVQRLPVCTMCSKVVDVTVMVCIEEVAHESHNNINYVHGKVKLLLFVII